MPPRQNIYLEHRSSQNPSPESSDEEEVESSLGHPSRIPSPMADQPEVREQAHLLTPDGNQAIMRGQIIRLPSGFTLAERAPETLGPITVNWLVGAFHEHEAWTAHASLQEIDSRDGQIAQLKKQLADLRAENT